MNGINNQPANYGAMCGTLATVASCMLTGNPTARKVGALVGAGCAAAISIFTRDAETSTLSLTTNALKQACASLLCSLGIAFSLQACSVNGLGFVLSSMIMLIIISEIFDNPAPQQQN